VSCVYDDVQFDHSSSNIDVGPQKIKWVSWSSDQTSPRDITVTKDGTVYVTGLVTDAGNATFGTGAGASVLDFGQVNLCPAPQFLRHSFLVPVGDKNNPGGAKISLSRPSCSAERRAARTGDCFRN